MYLTFLKFEKNVAFNVNFVISFHF